MMISIPVVAAGAVVGLGIALVMAGWRRPAPALLSRPLSLRSQPLAKALRSRPLAKALRLDRRAARTWPSWRRPSSCCSSARPGAPCSGCSSHPSWR